MMATRIISQDEYDRFDKNYNLAADMDDREVKLNNLIKEIEKDLILLGATAVEDKL